jgi:hypothetical protein
MPTGFFDASAQPALPLELVELVVAVLVPVDPPLPPLVDVPPEVSTLTLPPQPA